jgi:ABC-type Fe3+/spermidine/putrescine transport system ATPase subunit
MIIVTGLAGVSNCASSLMALARLKLCVAVVFSGAPLIFTPWRQFFDRIGAQFLSGHRQLKMTPTLEVRNLIKDFPGHRAVSDISFSIPQGSFFSLLGPSGCGKTTTLRMIAGFEQPTSGEVLLNGEKVNQRRPYERNVSTVFQNYALFPHLSARGNIEFGLKRQHVTNMENRVHEAIKLVGLAGKEERRPIQLSGGERQRVALARSLVLEPDVLLLDEPLAALDPKLRKQMRGELKAMQRRIGISFLLVTHDQEEALSMSDYVAVMNQGRVEQIGSPEEVYLHPRTRFVAGFLGAVNWIGEVGIRPESTRIASHPESNGAHSCSATVTDSVFLGDRVQVRVQLATGQEAVAQVTRGSTVFQPGEAVHICWNPADELSFP